MTHKLWFALVLVLGCHSGHDVGSIDPTIGAACTSDGNCDDRCFQHNNDHFPGRLCSLPCLGDRDCPLDTVCIDLQGGVCLFTCPAFDCSRLGAGWSCPDHDLVGGG